MITIIYEYLNFNRPMNKVNAFDSQRYSNYQNHCSITGMVERVTFHNSENGFCVIKVKVKVNGRENLVTVIGNSISILAGQSIEASGYWVREKDYGLQFKAEMLKILAPTTIEAIEKYLASGVIKSIGPVYAQKLVQIFGTEILDIIENKDPRLMKVPGISSIRAKNIWESWDKQKVIKDIMLFINNYNIGASKAIKIYKAYGEDAINVIKSNPYKLAADIHGIGFKTADEIATSIGIDQFSMLRIRAGIHYSLMTCINKGSCGLPTSTLIDLCCKLLTVNAELILEALSLEINERKVVVENINGAECIFLKGLAFAELRIAEILLYINRIQPPWGKLDDVKIQQYINDLINIKLSTSQLQAMHSAFTSKVMLITGGPGVGKTTLINSIITVFKRLNMKVLLAAPTGRAAKRVSEATKHPAYTIHRLIRRSPNQETQQSVKLRCELLILDEMSMVDVSMMYAVLSSLPSTAALFLVGDPDQLPSVGPGQVFKDLIESTTISTVRLTEVFRQENDSNIINNAMRINNGIMPTLRHKNDCSTPTDFYFIDSDMPENTADQIVSLVSTRLPAKFSISPFTDIQVLSPMTKGTIGTQNLNLLLQAALLPHVDSKDMLSIWGNNFKLGDKVMQTTNNYDKDVYNGDIGVITEINRTNQTTIIKFDNREVCYDFYELDEIVLAYAITVHKSQGSEYHTVIIPLMTQHYIMLQRKLIYTAITRAKHLAIIVGQKKALAIAVKNNIEERRYSSLYKRLIELNI